MPDLTLIKLGGSLITDKRKPGTARPEVIRRLAEELAAARKNLDEQLLVGHGSGSFGHEAASRHGLSGPLSTAAQRRGVSATQVEAGRLHWMVVEALAAAGADPYSFAPSSALQAAGGRLNLVPVEPVARALALGLVPVTYGDVVPDQSWGAVVCSTETVLLELAQRLRQRVFRIRRVLWLGETAGIYDAEGKTVPRITAANVDRVREALGEPAGTDVTGGMNLRLDTAWSLSRQGVASLILDGREPGALEEALAGKPVAGTEIPVRHVSRTSGGRARA